MKKVYFTVGPSQVYPTLYKHLNKAVKIDIPSLSHRGKEFKELFREATEGLRKLLNIPETFEIFFVSSALEAMERTMQGCCKITSFHLITGSFGKTWGSIATQLGKNVISREVQNTFQAGFSNLEIPEEAELICITQNDTSTGFWIPPSEISKIKKNCPEKLIAVDIVSSAPFVNLDFKFIDIAFFSVQKGFGLPAGLGVIIVSPKALKKTEELLNNQGIIGSYHSFQSLSNKAKDFQTPETPNALNIYLLNSVVKDMLKTDIDKIRENTNQKASLLYKFFESHDEFAPFIQKPEYRSNTTLVFDVKGKSEKLRKKLARFGYILGTGYGKYKQDHIRIANFPAHQLKDIKLMLNYF